jgi:hypothetical protein
MGCEKVRAVQSFQYKSLEDSGILMAGVGMALGLILMEQPGALVRTLDYSRCSGSHFLRLLVLLVLAAIPLLIFYNSLWFRIDLSISWLSVIVWACQSLGFFLALFMLVYVGPLALRKAKL